MDGEQEHDPATEEAGWEMRRDDYKRSNLLLELGHRRDIMEAPPHFSTDNVIAPVDSKTSETSTPEVGSKTALDTEACPWMMFINEDDGVPYYYNHITGECLWEPPQEFRRLQQEQQQLGQIDETTVAAIKKEELELLAQDESADSTLDNELTEKAATQVLVTPEFEDKVSGGVTSRPRASGAVPSLRFDTILSSAESSALEEEVPLNVVATEDQENVVDAIFVDELSEQIDDGRFPLTIHAKSAEESQAEENTVENERVFLASAQALLNNNVEEARDAGLESVDANEEVDVEAGIALESEATTAVANELSDSAALGQRTYIAALTLQCMVRGFVARQRVKQKREEHQKENTVAAENLPESAVIGTTPAVPPAMLQAVENEESLNNLPGRPALQTQQKESSLSNNALGPPSEDVSSTNDSFPVPPSIFDQQSPAISETSRFDPPVEGLPTAPSAAPSVPSSTPKQHSCSASVATRLPAVLDDNEKLLQTRRKEEEAAQRAKIVEYQRIYRESRKAFEAEKQRLQEEKQIRDNQRQHEAEAEKRSRVQTQHERDAARTRSMTAVDSADRLVWEYLQTQGRPNEQNIRQFRDALTETFDSTQFPDKMRAERARELQEPNAHCCSSWQRVLDEWEDHGSTSKYWGSIQARYSPSSAIPSSDESRRQYFLNWWRGAPGGDSLLHLAAWNGWKARSVAD
ncbi:WW domain [Phytophthora cactorum]|nr:WW domain [Phytophthora cactorum]